MRALSKASAWASSRLCRSEETTQNLHHFVHISNVDGRPSSGDDPYQTLNVQ